jgi:hypothetical protein
MAQYLVGRAYISIIGYLLLVLFQYLFLSVSINSSVMLVVSFSNFTTKIFSPDFDMDLTSKIFDLFKASLIDIKTYTLDEFFDKFYRTYMFPYYDIDLGSNVTKADYWSKRIGSNLVLLDMCLTVLISSLRLGIALGFLISFILRPLRELIMATFSRIIESDKPIFTLVCGGIAAVFQAAQQVITLFASSGAPPHA